MILWHELQNKLGPSLLLCTFKSADHGDELSSQIPHSREDKFDQMPPHLPCLPSPPPPGLNVDRCINHTMFRSCCWTKEKISRRTLAFHTKSTPSRNRFSIRPYVSTIVWRRWKSKLTFQTAWWWLAALKAGRSELLQNLAPHPWNRQFSLDSPNNLLSHTRK